MAARKQWSDLSERTRRLLITAAVAEGILKVAALIDIKRRPASQSEGRSGCRQLRRGRASLVFSCSGGDSLDRSLTDPVRCRGGLERREASDRRDQKPAVHTGYTRGR
jgi:hypothetical protein